MSISNIPESFPLPGTWITISSTGGVASTTYQVVIVATSSTGNTNTPVLAGSLADVASAFGSTSDIYKGYARYRSVDTVTPVYLVNAASASATDITAALTSLGDIPANLFITPFATSDAVKAFDTFLASRWAYNNGLDGIHVSAVADSMANLVALGSTVNSPYSSIEGFAPGGTDSNIELAAAVGAVIAMKASADPANPIQGISLAVAAAPLGNAFSQSAREAIFNAGIGITKQDTAGNVYLERPRMTYQTNAEGTADDSYEDIETLNILAYVRTKLQARLNSRFFGENSKKLVDNDTMIYPGSNAVNPNIILSEIIADYSENVDNLLCQDLATFLKTASARIVRTGVVEVYYPAKIAGVLRQITVGIQFSK